MDKIILNEMEFYGYHGLLKEEKVLGQRFIIDAELTMPLRKAGLSDRMEDSVDYGEVYKKVRHIVEGESINLIEALAEKIATTLLYHFPAIRACLIKVIKPNPPIDGHYQSVAIQIYRERDQ